MIDGVSLVSTTAAAPVGTAAEAGQDEGVFGQVLASLLGAAAQPSEVVAADATGAEVALAAAEPVVAEAGAVGPGTLGTGSSASPASGTPEGSQMAGDRPGDGGLGHGRGHGLPGVAVAGQAPSPDLPGGAGEATRTPAERAEAGKVASRASAAALRALAVAPAWSAVAVAARSQAEGRAEELPTVAEALAAGPVEAPADPQDVEVVLPEEVPPSQERAARRPQAPPQPTMGSAGDHQPQAAAGSAPGAEAPAPAQPRAEAAEVARPAAAERPAGVDVVDGAELVDGPAQAEAAAPGRADQPVPSSALRRVLEAVEALEHRPPPRTMAIDLPAEGGEEAMRLLVGLRGETVHVRIDGQESLPPAWVRELAASLARNGLELAGQGGGGREQGQESRAQQQEPPVAPGDARAKRPADDGALRL